MNGEISRFSVDNLLNMLGRTGMQVKAEVLPKAVWEQVLNAVEAISLITDESLPVELVLNHEPGLYIAQGDFNGAIEQTKRIV